MAATFLCQINGFSVPNFPAEPGLGSDGWSGFILSRRAACVGSSRWVDEAVEDGLNAMDEGVGVTWVLFNVLKARNPVSVPA